MTNKQPGYVYILTNPSFREDWVKIGKSSRPVDVRSKELDNTAVPLPFEIYATMKTVKYDEAERLVHKYIERFTNLRIRNNREFFNVKPEEALEIFKDVAQVLDDAEIEVNNKGKNQSVLGTSIATVSSRSSRQTSDLSHSNHFNHNYWDAFIQYMREHPSDLFSTPNATNDNWINIALGLNNAYICLIVSRRDLKAKIQLYLYTEVAKKNFDYLWRYKQQIEGSIGKDLQWLRKDNCISSTVELYKQCNPVNSMEWNDIFCWYREYTEKFIMAFLHLLQR